MEKKRGVRGLLSRLRSKDDERPRGPRSARVTAVAARKGGVGKTTTTVNLACALVKAGQRVLIIDIDPQGHVSSALRELVPAGPSASLSEVLLSDRPRDLMEVALASRLDGLHITPADKQLNEAEAVLGTKVGREYILQGLIECARTWFDAILIDCPPNLGNLTLNALVAADEVLIPCDMSVLALEGVADLLDTVDLVQRRLRVPVEVLGVLRTRVDGRTKRITNAIDEALRENYGPLLLETQIPVNSALAVAQAEGRSVLEHSPRSRGADAYRALATEYLTKAQAPAQSVAR